MTPTDPLEKQGTDEPTPSPFWTGHNGLPVPENGWTEDGESTTARVSLADRRLPPGFLLQDRYRVLSVLATGGMSSVYKAQDLRFSKAKRVCAIKEMRSDAIDPGVHLMILRNFERETNILAALSHPGIVQVYDCFSQANRSYLVLEYVQGRDLEAILDQTAGFIPEEEVVNWALQVCDVLTYLHNREPRPIVFRDIKPSNVMLDDFGRVRLVDFGIAKMLQRGKRGTMIGTEGYSPPEQYQGVADPCVDIYALGAMIHHLLSKRDPQLEPPFSFHERPIREANPNVSGELLEVVDRALKYEATDRYGSAAEMRRALANLRSARGARGTSVFAAQPVAGGTIVPNWRFSLEDEIRSSPTVHKEIVYVGAYDHNLYALDADDGSFLWKYAAEGGIASSPCVYEGIVFVGSVDRILYAVDASDGRIRWTCPTEGKIWSSPQAAFHHVFFGSDDRHLYAVNVDSGRIAWKFEAEGRVRSSPRIGDDAIYVGCEAGVVYAVDTGGGALWRFRARRSVTSSPAVTDEMVYVGSQDRYVYGLDARSGWLVWRYRTEGPIISSPTVGRGLVYIGSADGHLYALRAESGRLVWRYGTDGQVTSSPALLERKVYFGSVDGGIYALDAEGGDLLWRYQTNGPITSSPATTNEMVYVGSFDRCLYALPA